MAANADALDVLAIELPADLWAQVQAQAGAVGMSPEAFASHALSVAVPRLAGLNLSALRARRWRQRYGPKVIAAPPGRDVGAPWAPSYTRPLTLEHRHDCPACADRSPAVPDGAAHRCRTLPAGGDL